MNDPGNTQFEPITRATPFVVSHEPKPQGPSRFKRILPWLWVLVCASCISPALQYGNAVEVLGLIVSGACAVPPLWKVQQLVRVPLAARWIVGAITGIAAISGVTNATPKRTTAGASDDVSASKTDPLTKVSKAVSFAPVNDPWLVRHLGHDGADRANALRKGAFLAAAESDECDQATSADVAPEATGKNLYWLVDCRNENRFKVSAAQAQAALDRHDHPNGPAPAIPPIKEASCTWANLNACDYTPEQKAFDRSTAEAMCDAILDRVVLSKESLSPDWTHDYGATDHDGLVVRRGFKAANAYGVRLSSRYRCEIDAKSAKIRSFTIDGPMGSRRII